MNTSPSRADSGFAYSRASFEEPGRFRPGPCQEAGRHRRRRRGLRRLRPERLGAQGRAGERRAQPRQVAGRHGLRRPAARQCQHLRLLRRRHRADRAGGLRHRPLHGRRPGRRACPTRTTSPADEQPDLDLFHPWDITSEQAAALALECEARGLRHRQAHHQQRRRGRFGPAKPFLQRPHARLSRRLCQLAPFDLGGADRRQGRRHAARRLVQLDARGRRAGQRRRPWAATRPSARWRA